MSDAAPQPSAQARQVAQMLVQHLSSAQGCGATTSDIAAGYQIAADRVARWALHKSWPQLRNGR